MKTTAPQHRPARRGAAAPVADGPWQGGALQRAQAAQVAALEASPVMRAQRHRLDRLTGAAAQRKVLVGKAERPAEETDDPKLKAATSDEYLRFYDSEPEMRDHLVDEKPVPVGLIERLALWYRLPDFTDSFFVFGEFHPGVKGSQVQEASHFDKPILDEGQIGWTSGAEAETSTTAKQPVNEGLDENGAKLWRSLEYVTMLAQERLQALDTPTNSSTGGSTPSPLPTIPPGQSSTRITGDRSYRLVVRGESDQPKLWVPKEPVSSSSYDIGTVAGDVVSTLFPLVFAGPIAERSLDHVKPGLADAWSAYPTLAGATEKDPLERLIVALGVMGEATATWVRRQYETARASSPETKLTEAAWLTGFAKIDRNVNESDRFRDEYMLLRVHQAARSGGFAFASMGDAHRKRLDDRLERIGVKTLSADDFYGQCIQDAVET